MSFRKFMPLSRVDMSIVYVTIGAGILCSALSQAQVDPQTSPLTLPPVTAIAPAMPIVAPTAPIAKDGILVLDPTAGQVPTATLEEATRRELSGVDLLDTDQKLLPIIRAQAETFIRWKRGRLSQKEKTNLYADCLAAPLENPYCEWITATGGSHTTVEEATARTWQPVPNLTAVLTNADLKALKGVHGAQLHQVLKSFPLWDPLEGIAQAALKASECPSPELLTSLGQKAEEFFPDPKYQVKALALYERATACSGAMPAVDPAILAKYGEPKEDAVDRARYRLSLIQIMGGNCRAAAPHLAILSDKKDGDFFSRSLYWRSYCAETTGNKVLAAALQGRLTRENPLSYHGLMLSHKPQLTWSRWSDVKDPSVTMRSRLKPGLNPTIRAIEVLQAIGAHDGATELLESVKNRMSGSESPFRLYVALLMTRSGNAIGRFKVLSSLFQDDSSFINVATLEMFYPLKRFEVIKAAKKVDPYLIAALIRQESGFNEHARSPAGAMGLMQLMPKTARTMERFGSRHLMDPRVNIRLGVRYFFGLLDRFSGDAELALAAYNAGPEKVDEWKRRYPTTNRMLFVDLIPFRETRNYVALIGRNYYWYVKLYGTAAGLPTVRPQGGSDVLGKRVSLFSISRYL